MTNDERILRGMEAGVAQIVDAANDHRGMAILVAPRCAVTCAHVVTMALGSNAPNAAPGPEAAVTLKFPMLSGDYSRLGRVICWRPPAFEPNSDIAVLALDDDAPEEASCAILGDIRRVSLEGDRLDVFGMEGGKLGVRVDLKFMGKPGRAWVQIDGRGESGFFVKPGFSWRRSLGSHT